MDAQQLIYLKDHKGLNCLEIQLQDSPFELGPAEALWTRSTTAFVWAYDDIWV